MSIKTVCVYCASSSNADSIYINAAHTLGKIFADNNIHCIFGAGETGLMGALAKGVSENRGKITGIIPQFMVDRGWCNKTLTNVEITPTIHQRKERMAQLSDAVIAMPGGCGTFEELMEIITWKQLGLYKGKIIILNINSYFTPLINMLEQAIEQKFMRAEHKWLWQVAKTPQEAFDIANKEL